MTVNRSFRFALYSVIFLPFLPALYAGWPTKPNTVHTVMLPPQCTGVLGDNILPQGDFGTGSDSILQVDPGFSPTYGYSLFGPPDLGNYTITNNTAGWTGSADVWLDIGDNSDDPEGYMMVIDADLNPGIFFEQVVDVCPGTTYDFSADIINLIEPGASPLLEPNVDFLVDGINELSTGDIAQDGTWNNYGFTFTTGPGQTSITIALRNNSSGDAGNDLAIDNITIRPCISAINLTEINPTTHCSGDTVTLSVSLDPGLGNEFFQWQVSTDSGQTWVNFQAPSSDTFLIAENIPNNAQFQVAVATSIDNLQNAACTVTGGSLVLNYNAPEDCLASISTFGSLCTGSLGQNVFPNGDFGSGTENILPDDPGYAPGYVYELNPPPDDGTYTITNNTEPWGGFAADTWINIGDNSDDPEGYMMVINASQDPGLFFEGTIDVCENTLYQFSTDVIAMNIPEISDGFIEPNISFLVDGVDVFNTGNVPIDATWRTFGFSFTTAPGVTQINLGIRNNTPGGNSFVGNDLAIDNVFLGACGPEVNISELNPMTYCAGDTIRLSADIGAGFTDPMIQWQISTDGGMNFINAGPPSSDNTFISSSISVNAQARAVVAASSANLGTPSCSILSDTVFLAFDDINDCLELPINVMNEPCTGQPGTNIVPNGDFGADSLLFAPALADGITTYNYRTDSFNMEGSYTITNSLEFDPCFGQNPDSCWIATEDNSEDSLGYFMVVNAGPEPDILFQSEITGLCENTTYQFSASIINLANPSFFPFNPNGIDTTILPNIDFLVTPSGTPINVLEIYPPTYNTGDILNDTTWNTYGFTFTMKPGQTGFLLALRNNAPGGNGNDLGLDNINISVCGPISTIEPYAICPDETLTLTANIQGDQFADPAIQWLESTDGGQNFSLLNGETNPTLDLGIPTPGNQYVYLVANDPVSITQENCRINSEIDTISVIPILRDTIVANLCTGQSIQVGNTTYNTTGSFTETLTSSLGCDSIVQLELTVFNSTSIDLDQTICDGEVFQVGNSSYTTQGQYVDTLLAANGCDSIVRLNLTVLDTILITNTVTLCPGDTFMGQSFSQDTTLVEQFTTNGNCDSTIVTNIQLSQLQDFAISGPNFICQGNTSTLSAGTAATYLWSTGSTDASIAISTAGIYSVTVTDDLGCTAEDDIEINISQVEATVTTTPPSCFGDSDAGISIDNVTGGSGNYLFSLDNLPPQSEPLFLGLSAGTYQVIIEDVDLGCSITRSTTITSPPPLTVDLGEDQLIGLSDSIPLFAEVDFPIETIVWTPADSLSCTDCLNPIANPTNTTTYTVTAFDANGCSQTDEITIRVQVLRRVFVPNAFSPNEDGVNDTFTIFGANEIEEVTEMKIFNRWGDLLFESGPFSPGDIASGWNGTYRGQFVNSGVYLYFAEIRYKDGTTEVISGDVTVVR